MAGLNADLERSWAYSIQGGSNTRAGGTTINGAGNALVCGYSILDGAHLFEIAPDGTIITTHELGPGVGFNEPADMLVAGGVLYMCGETTKAAMDWGSSGAILQGEFISPQNISGELVVKTFTPVEVEFEWIESAGTTEIEEDGSNFFTVVTELPLTE